MQTINETKEQNKHSRQELNLSVRVVILSQLSGQIIEEGQAIIRHLKLTGVVISDLELPNQALPLTPFQIALIIEEEPLKRIHMLCSVRQFFHNGNPGLVLNIDKIPEKHRARLWEFIRK